MAVRTRAHLSLDEPQAGASSCTVRQVIGFQRARLPRACSVAGSIRRAPLITVCVIKAAYPTAFKERCAQGLALCLKEWAVTCAALGEGDQTVVLRKGGIREPTFKPAGSCFLLFPTAFHTEASLLTPAASEKYAKELQAEPKQLSHLHLDYVAEVTGAWTTQDPTMLERLSDFHVWSPEFLNTRLRWRPKQPVTILELRTSRLPQPFVVPSEEAYWGCFSWVTLEQCLGADALAAAVPVLDDATYADKQESLRQALQDLEDLQDIAY